MIPKQLERQVIDWYHNKLCHPGETRTKLSFSWYFYWKKMCKIAHKIWTKCKAYQFMNRNKKEHGKLSSQGSRNNSMGRFMSKPNLQLPVHRSRRTTENRKSTNWSRKKNKMTAEVRKIGLLTSCSYDWSDLRLCINSYSPVCSGRSNSQSSITSLDDTLPTFLQGNSE